MARKFGGLIKPMSYAVLQKGFGVKKSTKNDFVYGKLGRTNYLNNLYIISIEHWFKILQASGNKYIKLVNNFMLQDLELLHNKCLGFFEVWL